MVWIPRLICLNIWSQMVVMSKKVIETLGGRVLMGEDVPGMGLEAI